MNYALLLSGGIGTRIGAELPKQYMKAGGHMMVSYALMPLLKCSYTDKVYIVCENAWKDEMLADVRSLEVGLGIESGRGIDSGLGSESGFGSGDSKVAGFALPGANRQLSVVSGMEAILADDSGDNESVGDATLFGSDDTILIHDGARPFLTVEMLDKCYSALSGHDGVMPVLPMKDTVYESADGKSVSKLLNRQKIFAGQAPELFNLKKYYDANMALMPDKINEVNGATEPAIMHGMDIAMIPGDENNYKITSKEDLSEFIRIKEGE